MEEKEKEVKPIKKELSTAEKYRQKNKFKGMNKYAVREIYNIEDERVRKSYTSIKWLIATVIFTILVVLINTNPELFYTKKDGQYFTNNLVKIFEAAKEDYSTSNSTGNIVVYSNTDCDNCKALDVKSDVSYYIIVDESGTVTNYYANNNNYQYVKDETIIEESEISEKDVQTKINTPEEEIISLETDGVEKINHSPDEETIDSEFEDDKEYY